MAIVCSVDDSEGAHAVVAVAHELSAALRRRLLLLHVAPPTEAPGVSAAPAGQERLREAETADARELLERLARDEGLGDEVELRVEIGSPAERILATCADADATFVVVGTRGRGDLRSALLGSVSHAVASAASCPVVLVPPAASERLER